MAENTQLEYTFEGSFTENNDKVRWLIGDTKDPGISGNLLLSNEEIAFALTENDDEPLRAAIACCRHLMARFARGGKKRASRQEHDHSMLRDHFKEVLKDLIARNPSVDAFIAGNLDAAGIKARHASTVIRQPRFKLGMHDHPNVSGSDTTSDPVT